VFTLTECGYSQVIIILKILKNGLPKQKRCIALFSEGTQYLGMGMEKICWVLVNYEDICFVISENAWGILYPI